MTEDTMQERLQGFIEFWKTLKGYEKGEAQLFLDHLFRALGHEDGVHSAGASFEDQIKKKKSTKFADLHWPGRVLIEMKKRKSDLAKHYDQAFDYWTHLTPNRPQYVILCNFDEFYVYDFNLQVEEPVDKLKTEDILARFTSLNFLLPGNKTPIFANNLIEVTRIAAQKATDVYKSIVNRGYDQADSQRFILQCVFCMFAEDFELLPTGLFTEIVEDSISQDAGYSLDVLP
ncbi:hypothetical protein SYK_12000 [Pseudodesulfovibrio nedwellii]|uniref:Class I SAM-dependent DNA methyltransferase n=1 Tax=Pseudodesulfovibrio nedwellii TaxID=2973072 RepID=A0ABM8AZ82_9BACT|nr:type IIL restriction-modification enzyme MmeI [Pseudodesulfovibrio nedwellii]BDQ36840.1 hypothetical protein SYK_12000 [Pseudodesulfovibrio nedwellii]